MLKNSLLKALPLAAFLLLGACGAEPEAPAPTPSATHVASAKGRVDIEGGLVRLAAQREGVIEQVLVEEGERVQAGQLLAVLADSQPRRALELTQAETAQARAALPALQLRLAVARRELARLQPLLGDSVAAQELDAARDQLELLRAEENQALAAVKVSQQRERVAMDELAQRRVRAPLAGTIVRRTARPGDGVSVATVTPLFLFAPDAPLIVRAEVEERWLAQLQVGQAAQVQLEADEALPLMPAQVLRIAPVVGNRTPGDDPAERQDMRVAEVVLALPSGRPRIGQRVIVRFAAAAKAGG